MTDKGFTLTHTTHTNPPAIDGDSVNIEQPSGKKTVVVVLVILIVQLAVMIPNISIYSSNPHSNSCASVNEFITGFIIFHGCWILWTLWAPATMMHGLFGVYQGLCFALCLWLGMFTWANVGIVRLASNTDCNSDQSNMYSLAIVDIVFTYAGSFVGCLLFCWRFGLIRAFRRNHSNILSQVANLDADTLVDPWMFQQKQQEQEERRMVQNPVAKVEESGGFTFSPS